MTILGGLDGATALILLNALLFAEEAGVPIPFAPGEVVLIAAGLLIASGGLAWWLFIPAAFVACGTGSLVAYSWARALGASSLRALAVRLHAAGTYDRVARRIAVTGPLGIALSRLIPGLRIYTSLVAGATGVDRRVFLGGALPATAVWVAGFTLLGALVGLPAERAWGDVEGLAVRGVVLGAAGFGTYLAIRHVHAGASPPEHSLAGHSVLRLALAAAIDVGVLASILLAVATFARLAFGVRERAGWIEGLVIVSLVAVGYLIVTRRSVGATAGERLTGVSYVKRHELQHESHARSH